jgi:hypothetical protein
MVHRRRSNAVLRALLLSSLAALAGCGSDDKTSVADAADRAYTYALPLYQLSATRELAWSTVVQRPNVFAHSPTLATAASRSVTTPNHDTLYSSAWLLLDGGPLEIDTPDSGSRYFSLALMDFYSNNIAVLGTRRDGGVAKRFWLVGPNWQGTVPDGTELLRSPTNSLWALGRTYVSGDTTDYPAAHAVQQQLKIVIPSGTTTAKPASASVTPPALTDWNSYFSYVDTLLAENPPPAADDFYLAGPETIGVGAGLSFDPSKVDATQLAAGASRAYARASGAASGTVVQGWVYPKSDLGAFGTDYDYRATVALSGLGALPNAEAEYFYGGGDGTTQRYDGNQNYTLTFPPGQLPPSGAFWSLTLYEAESNGSLFFYDNPQNRYALSYPASGLTQGTDGSLTLYLSHSDPGGDKSTNWLPSPAGPFEVVMRIYLPQANVLDGSYHLPPVQRQ